ncbi:GNAT family N-acetyltransferase [Puia dinghuensis]|uniref:GNAT family N-acetyltransferase n=1 Tax=Puia dinghuensis TaxID=1792502 RepID=A0A8J2UBQ6_9BACT|nr:GNAT family N-acetyltransferase [Puia dinghuensis]GGA95161.1 GNAT family N-acetyltransferase [Puia dinghuensis]
MIRRAIPADAPGISRLLTQLEYPGTERFITTRLATLLAHPDEVFLVWAEPANHILAFLSLHFIPQIALEGDFARISYFAVDESARSLGIGQQLEAEATRLAKERGCALLEVHCHTRRTRAHAFYHRQGYEESPKYLIKKLS